MMAEIGIQEKKGPSPWVWLVGLLVLALVVWVVVDATGRDDEFTGTAEPAAVDRDTIGWLDQARVDSPFRLVVDDTALPV
jgi:hypothetical protein